MHPRGSGSDGGGSLGCRILEAGLGTLEARLGRKPRLFTTKLEYTRGANRIRVRGGGVIITEGVLGQVVAELDTE